MAADTMSLKEVRMVRKGIKFVAVITLSHFVTYYVAGVIAQVFLGEKRGRDTQQRRAG